MMKNNERKKETWEIISAFLALDGFDPRKNKVLQNMQASKAIKTFFKGDPPAEKERARFIMHMILGHEDFEIRDKCPIGYFSIKGIVGLKNISGSLFKTFLQIPSFTLRSYTVGFAQYCFPKYFVNKKERDALSTFFIGLDQSDKKYQDKSSVKEDGLTTIKLTSVFYLGMMFFNNLKFLRGGIQFGTWCYAPLEMILHLYGKKKASNRTAENLNVELKEQKICDKNKLPEGEIKQEIIEIQGKDDKNNNNIKFKP
jgi:hypothetical protein